MRDRRAELLEAMGIAFIPGRVQPPFGPQRAPALSSTEPRPDRVTTPSAEGAEGWASLETRVQHCERCELHCTRTQTVFGTGLRTARWMFVGEAPGEQEDLQGQPFVGRAGQLLNEMIYAVGFQREEVYIANVLKCRPPKNRDPSASESEACEPYLQEQLKLVQPQMIVAVGRIAAQNLLKTETPIGKLRGQVHHYEGIPLVVTYHPAYLLRSQTEKRRAWEDLKLAKSVLPKV